MKSTAIAIFAGLGICVAAGTAGATVFQIDEFQVTENDQTVWLDPFDNMVPPQDRSLPGQDPAPGVAPNPFDRAYLTRPDALPGPETGGKLALDPAQGFLNIGVVTPVANRIQRARVNFFTSAPSTPPPTNGYLTTGDTIVVSALYDLIEPLQNTEYYGIRVTDWANDIQNEGLRLAVRKNLSGVWEVVFSQAEIGVQWNTIQSLTLTDIVGIEGYEQIALSLFNNPSVDGDAFSAQFTLIDLENIVPDQMITFASQGMMFQVSDWLRPEFLAGVRVPEPAVLSLFALGLAGIGCVSRTKRRKTLN